MSYNVDGPANHGYLTRETGKVRYAARDSSPAPEPSGIASFIPSWRQRRGDSARFNDTLRATICKLPRRDVAVTGITGMENPVCDAAALALVRLANASADAVQALRFLPVQRR